MKDLVAVMARALVKAPDAVDVAEVSEPRATILELSVDPADRGKIIGRGGRTIRAMRVVLDAAGHKAGKRYDLEIRE